MELDPRAVRVKNGKSYVPISLSFFLSSAGECRYVCGERRYLPAPAQLVSRSIGAVISGCAAALLYTGMKLLGTVAPMPLIHGLTAFVVFVEMLMLCLSQWLPLRLLPWSVQERPAAKGSEKRKRVCAILLPLLLFAAAAGILSFLL